MLLVANADHKFLDVHDVQAIRLARLADELLGEISQTDFEIDTWELHKTTFHWKMLLNNLAIGWCKVVSLDLNA